MNEYKKGQRVKVNVFDFEKKGTYECYTEGTMYPHEVFIDGLPHATPLAESEIAILERPSLCTWELLDEKI